MMIILEQLVEWMSGTRSRNTRKNQPQCHSVDHRSHMTWIGLEPWPPRWEAATDRLIQGMAHPRRVTNDIQTGHRTPTASELLFLRPTPLGIVFCPRLLIQYTSRLWGCRLCHFDRALTPRHATKLRTNKHSDWHLFHCSMPNTVTPPVVHCTDIIVWWYWMVLRLFLFRTAVSKMASETRSKHILF
jgi:hypothetical protein